MKAREEGLALISASLASSDFNILQTLYSDFGHRFFQRTAEA